MNRRYKRVLVYVFVLMCTGIGCHEIDKAALEFPFYFTSSAFGQQLEISTMHS